MKIALVFTNDWELFGDGSGSYYEVQHKPLAELLPLLSAYDAKITLMAEVMQQFYHQSIAAENPEAREISNSWENIIRDAAVRGHDVQLHLHPQWQGAKYTGGKWQCDMDKWKLSAHSPETIEMMIKRGKEYLEQLIAPVNPDYKCIAFRAGGYGIQPEKEIIGILKRNGFVADTSVSKGLYSQDMYDFREAPSNIIPWHTTPENLCRTGSPNEGLLELPIYSVKKFHSLLMKKYAPGLYYSHAFDTDASAGELNWIKERDKIKSVRYPVANRFYKKTGKKGIKFYLKAFLAENVFQLDYDYLPASAFLKTLEGILQDENLAKYTAKGITIPVVASGHVKDMHNTKNIELILKGVKKNFANDIAYQTLSEAITNWQKITENNNNQEIR